MVSVPPMNGQVPRLTVRTCPFFSSNETSPPVTSMPGFTEATFRTWLGAVVRPSRSVNTIVPEAPFTGPKAAARSSASLENSPLLVTSLSSQSMRPVPVMVPETLATTPSASGVRVSGCSVGPNVSPSTARSAWPRPLERSWRKATRVTATSVFGSRSSASAVIALSFRASVAFREISGANRAGCCRSTRRKAPSAMARRPSV